MRGEQLQASFFIKSFLMKKECFLSVFELNLVFTADRGLEQQRICEHILRLRLRNAMRGSSTTKTIEGCFLFSNPAPILCESLR